MVMGRPNKGVHHIDGCDGSELSKQRTKLILETITGERSVQSACDELGIQREAPLAPLVLGASTTIEAGLVPKLFASFRAQNGAAGLRLVVGNTSEIIAQVETGALPFGLV